MDLLHDCWTWFWSNIWVDGLLTICRDSVFSFFLLRHFAAAILFLSLLLFFLSCSSGATCKPKRTISLDTKQTKGKERTLVAARLTSLLSPARPEGLSEARSELELTPSELTSAPSPLDRRLLWMASRSSSFTMGVKLVKSSRVNEPGGERHGTRAEQLMSARDGPGCCSIILKKQWDKQYTLLHFYTLYYTLLHFITLYYTFIHFYYTFIQ